MDNERVEFALNNFIEANYFAEESRNYTLEENDKTGLSRLEVNLTNENLCIIDYDNKHKCTFVRTEGKYGMNKSVDHVIFENKNNIWIVHLIEMKSTVGHNTWVDIKAKVRASYLHVLALADFLGIQIAEFKVYTTYEKEKFESVKNTTNPKIYQASLGGKAENYKKQWDNHYIQIDFDKPKTFSHTPVLMIRNRENNTLEGNIEIS